MKQSKNVAALVRELVLPLCEEFGYILWDVEYVKEGADMILRITIDTDAEGGISIDAARSLPLSATFGGWYRMGQWRFFADLTLGNDERLRLGCGYDF